MIRMATVPSVSAHAAIVSATLGSLGSTGLIDREPAGMGGADVQGVARVVTVHGVGRDQQRAVDADGVHGLDHVVPCDLGWAVKNRGPRAARTVALVGVNLDIDRQHERPPPDHRSARSGGSASRMEPAVRHREARSRHRGVQERRPTQPALRQASCSVSASAGPGPASPIRRKRARPGFPRTS